MGRSDRDRSRSRDRRKDRKKKDKKHKRDKKDKKEKKSKKSKFDFSDLSSFGKGTGNWADGPATHKIRDEEGNIIEDALLPKVDGETTALQGALQKGMSSLFKDLLSQSKMDNRQDAGGGKGESRFRSLF